jgi:hypothetical protein
MAVAPTMLDDILRLYDVHEVHERMVSAPPEAVWQALYATRFSEFPLAKLLLGLRAVPRWLSNRKRPRPGLDLPALDALLQAGFVPLGEVPRQEVAIGAVGRFWRLTTNRPLPLKDRVDFMQFTAPGYARAAMSFRLVPEVGGTRLITETRVAGTDPASSRAFRRYWWVIRLGSGALRRVWLAAIARRAEAQPAK